MIKKVIVIVVPVLVISLLLFLFGYKIQLSLYGNFPIEGHIITHNSKGKVTKYYFESGTRYKKVNNNKIVFEDTDDTEVQVPKETFVHYVDGSVSTLKKAVILDLSTLGDEVFKYYSIFDFSYLCLCRRS